MRKRATIFENQAINFVLAPVTFERTELFEVRKKKEEVTRSQKYRRQEPEETRDITTNGEYKATNKQTRRIYRYIVQAQRLT